MRIAEERRFVSHDGTELFYRHWPGAAGAARNAIILFHRGHERARRRRRAPQAPRRRMFVQQGHERG
jgi:alpha-beta hydrolase superfamily lysophospholipase